MTGAGLTAPIREEAETETKPSPDRSDLFNSAAEYEGPPQSPRHRPPHAYKAKDGRTPVFRPPSAANHAQSTPQTAEYETAPAATSDRDAHPEASTGYEAMPPDLAAYEADQTQPAIEYGTTYPRATGYESSHAPTAGVGGHSPAAAAYETSDVPSTGLGANHQPVEESSRTAVMYEDETPIQPSGEKSGKPALRLQAYTFVASCFGMQETAGAFLLRKILSWQVTM